MEKLIGELTIYLMKEISGSEAFEDGKIYILKELYDAFRPKAKNTAESTGENEGYAIIGPDDNKELEPEIDFNDKISGVLFTHYVMSKSNGTKGNDHEYYFDFVNGCNKTIKEIVRILELNDATLNGGIFKNEDKTFAGVLDGINNKIIVNQNRIK